MMFRFIFILSVLFFMEGGAVGAQESSFVYDDHQKRDPFQPLVSSSGAIINMTGDLSISDMVLEGVIAGDNGGSLAIINGVIVKSKDKLGLYTVEQIDPGQVILSKGQEKFVLKLKKEE